jgi:hypothetical protein
MSHNASGLWLGRPLGKPPSEPTGKPRKTELERLLDAVGFTVVVIAAAWFSDAHGLPGAILFFAPVTFFAGYHTGGH